MSLSEIEDPIHAEEAEKISQRDAKIVKDRNEIRYKECLSEAEAFFNTMYPIAVKHAKLVLNDKKFDKDIPVLVRDVLLGYMQIWVVILSKKYK